MWEGVDGCGLTALGWVRLGRAPGHGNGAEGRLTDWLHGWFELVFTLPPHFIFSHLYLRVWLSGCECWERVSVCVCARCIHICVHVRFYILVWINDCGSFHRNTHPHSSMAFHRLPACLALPSLALTWAPAHTLASDMWFRADVAVYESNAVIPQPPSCVVLLNTAQKQVPLLCLFENCSPMNKTHNATSLFLPSFSFFLLCSFPLSHYLGHHPLWI